MTAPDLRNWKERNQGLMPQADPHSLHPGVGADIARNDESDDPSGAVPGEPGSSGTSGDGVRGSGSFGGTGSPNSFTQRDPKP
jgi:hypothetical protein